MKGIYISMTLEEFTGSRYIRLKRIDELMQAGRLDNSLRWQRAAVGAPDHGPGSMVGDSQ